MLASGPSKVSPTSVLGGEINTQHAQLEEQLVTGDSIRVLGNPSPCRPPLVPHKKENSKVQFVEDNSDGARCRNMVEFMSLPANPKVQRLITVLVQMVHAGWKSPAPGLEESLMMARFGSDGILQTWQQVLACLLWQHPYM